MHELGDFQFVQDGLDLLEPRPLVGISVPADVDDPLKVVVDKLGNDRAGIILHNLHPHVHGGKPVEGDFPRCNFPQYDGKAVHVTGSFVDILQPVSQV